MKPSLLALSLCLFLGSSTWAAGGDPNEHIVNGGRYHGKGWTIFHEAVYNSDIESVVALLNAGAKVNSRFDFWQDKEHDEGLTEATAPFIVALLGDSDRDTERLKMLNLLLARGANPNAIESHNGWSLLMCWAASGDQHSQGIAALLKAGAKVNASDRQGQTALHLAALNDKVPCVRTLLKANSTSAFVDARDQLGRTALQRAFETDTYEGVLTKSENIDVYVPTIAALVKAGASLSVKSKDGSSLMNSAAECVDHINTTKCEYLWQHGMKDVDVRNNKGESPLLLACRRSDVYLASYLLARGANPDAPAKDGTTPRQIVSRPFHMERPTAPKMTPTEKKQINAYYQLYDNEFDKKNKQILAFMNRKTSKLTP